MPVKVWKENNKAAMDPMPHLTNAHIDDITAWIAIYEPAVTPPGGGGGNAISMDEAEGLGSLWNWARFLIFVIVILLANIAMQIAKLRGVEFLAGVHMDKVNARLMLAFWIFGLIAAVWSTGLFRNYFIFSNSASEHGQDIDNLFWGNHGGGSAGVCGDEYAAVLLRLEIRQRRRSQSKILS